MQNDNLYKKLRCILLIIAIISMIIALTKKVHAEEMDSSLKSDVIEIFNTYFTGYTNEQIDNVTSDCPYVCIYPANIDGHNIYIADFFNTKEMGINCVFINNYYFTSGYSGYKNNHKNYIVVNGTDNNYVANTGTCYRFVSDATNNTLQQFISFPVVSSIPELDGVWYPNLYFLKEDRNIIFSNMSFSSSSYNISSVPLISYGSYYQNYGNKLYRVINDTFTPINENTNGFSVFKYNNLGIDTLRIVPPKNKVIVGSHTSNISSVTFDLVIDDTIVPTTYNSDSDYYFESIEYNRAYYEIPISALLPSSINDFNNVYITNLIYNNTWENQGGESGTDTFYYVDKVYLKQTIDNEDISQISIAHVDTNTGYDETHITDIYNMITNASSISGEFNTEKNLVGGSSTPYSFTSFQDAIVRTVECYHPTGTKSSDWTPIINENGIDFESGDNLYWLEYDNNTQVFNKRYNYNISPYSYIRENNYTGYYDIMYFIVHEQIYTSNGTGFSTLSNSYTRYFYFISDRYYNKLILYREMDIMEYIKLNNEISEKVYNYIYDRLLNIDDNIYYFIKDKANIDNDILNALENIDNDMQFNLDNLNDLINKILAALSDLNLSQLDTIETKLNTIIANIGQSNYQNEDDTVAEAIQYYKSHNTNGIPSGQVYIDDKMSIWISGKVHLWLQGTDANTDKTNLINSVFDTLTSIYDSMKNNNDIFPNIQYFLDAIAKNNNYGYETHGDYMTRLFKGNVDISTYNGISE